MKRLIWLLLLLTAVSLAQEAPTENPSEVWVKGRKIDHSWKGGRIWVATSDLKVLLNMDSEDGARVMDLLTALEEKGGYVWSVEGGKFEAKRDRSLYGEANTSRARARNRRTARASRTRSEGLKRAKSDELNLQYEVVEIDTEWGYKWGAVKVTNMGSTRSDVCKAFCHFQDGFGRTYAEDWWPVRSLEPGESQTFAISSGTETQDTSITPTNDNISVTFYSMEDASKNATSRSEARKRARRNKKKKGLDFNKGWGKIGH